jgi:SPX domain protein involved in polyphosphate accumulation
MRFGKSLRHLAIPEWKQCYLDYEHLKIFISVIKLIVDTIHYCEKKMKED